MICLIIIIIIFIFKQSIFIIFREADWLLTFCLLSVHAIFIFNWQNFFFSFFLFSFPEHVEMNSDVVGGKRKKKSYSWNYNFNFFFLSFNLNWIDRHMWVYDCGNMWLDFFLRNEKKEKKNRRGSRKSLMLIYKHPDDDILVAFNFNIS